MSNTIDGQQEADIRRETLLDCWRRPMKVTEIAHDLDEPIEDVYRSLKEIQKAIVAEERGEKP